MSNNPNYDFDLTAELLESFSSHVLPQRAVPQAEATPAFVPVSQSELEDANAAFGRMLDDYLAESMQKVA